MYFTFRFTCFPLRIVLLPVNNINFGVTFKRNLVNTNGSLRFKGNGVFFSQENLTFFKCVYVTDFRHLREICL